MQDEGSRQEAVNLDEQVPVTVWLIFDQSGGEAIRRNLARDF
jgi:hypothetical protein